MGKSCPGRKRMLNSIAHIGRRSILNQLKLDILSNNISNMGTYGYKRDGITFRIPTEDDQKNEKSLYSLFPFGGKTYVDFTPGTYKFTGNPLDLTIKGDGFFVVESSQGNLYTRRGDFAVDQQGRIVTKDGKLVVGEGGPITVAGADIQVDSEGNVYSDNELVGKLKIVTFGDLTNLEKVEGSYLKLTDPQLQGQEKTPEGTEVWQGYVEMSNVDVVSFMVEMITLLRAHESYKNAIDAMREADRKDAQEVGLVR